MGNITSVLNLKELIYDKFKGFKKFQIITISTMGTELILQDVKKVRPSFFFEYRH